MTPDTALAPHTPVPINYTLTNGTVGELAEAINEQWQRAQGGLIEILRFGALMIRIDNRLGGGKQRNRHSGQTLKGWLKEHCPEINYKTAIGYKAAAVGLAEAAELPDNMPLLALMEGDRAFEDDYAEAHARVMDVIGTASIGFLKAQSRRGGARDGAGRPPKAEHDPGAELTDALILSNRFLTDIRTWALADDGLGALPDDVLAQWLTQMGDVIKRGREILNGRRIAAKTRRTAR